MQVERWILPGFVVAIVIGLSGGKALAEAYAHAEQAAVARVEQAAVNASPVAVPLPRELSLEMELQVARDERDQILNRFEALQLQAQQLSTIVDQFIAQVQGPRLEQGNAARRAVEQKLITALGGDPAKGDTFDWRSRTLLKKDGTQVAIPKPEEKK